MWASGGERQRGGKCLMNDLHSNYIMFCHFICALQYKFCSLFVVKILDFVVSCHLFVACGLLYAFAVNYQLSTKSNLKLTINYQLNHT